MKPLVANYQDSNSPFSFCVNYWAENVCRTNKPPQNYVGTNYHYNLLEFVCCFTAHQHYLGY